MTTDEDFTDIPQHAIDAAREEIDMDVIEPAHAQDWGGVTPKPRAQG